MKKFFKNSNITAKITFVSYWYRRIKFKQKKIIHSIKIIIKVQHFFNQNYNKNTTFFFNQNHNKSITFFNQDYSKSITFFLVKIITKVLHFF